MNEMRSTTGDWIWTLIVELMDGKVGFIQVSVLDSGWRRAVAVWLLKTQRKWREDRLPQAIRL